MGLPNLTDVLVVGAGPVGLLTALGLAQQSIDIMVIEKRSLAEQQKFGRACTLYPRTMELLEAFDVAHEIAQNAFIGRSYATYSNGQRTTRKAWQSMFPMMESSYHNYIVNIRQNCSQSIFATKLKTQYDKEVNFECELVEYSVDPDSSDGYHVKAIVSHPIHGKQLIKCKYLVGADGGQSTVRNLAGIDMEGAETTYKWVRLDGLFKTDIPEPDVVFAALETSNHGNVLWVKLDGDAYRIGFALNSTLQAKYPEGPSELQVKYEAREALKPFNLEIERLDWWTYYTVKQKVAATMRKDKYILLAGDAAHTHSSAFAQGMNTGVHDATNLVWKLAGVLRGWLKEDILDTYTDERRAAAQKLISIDKLAVQAVSGDIPEGLRHLGMSAQEALKSILEQNMSFTIGLGIGYETSILCKEPTCSTLAAGVRSPDALVQAPGPGVPVRVHSITHGSKNSHGKWSILVFTNRGSKTRGDYAELRKRFSGSESILGTNLDKINMTTILLHPAPSVWSALDGESIGDLYFDLDQVAHDRYGIYPDNGGVVILRPDGIFAFAAGLKEFDKVEEFFEPIFM